MVAGLLAHIHELGVASRQGQYLGRDQTIVHDHIGLIEQTQSAQGQQTWIAGAGTDQRNATFAETRRLFFQRSLQRLLRVDGAALAQQGRNLSGQ